jgi:hypothetical protein
LFSGTRFALGEGVCFRKRGLHEVTWFALGDGTGRGCVLDAGNDICTRLVLYLLATSVMPRIATSTILQVTRYYYWDDVE